MYSRETEPEEGKDPCWISWPGHSLGPVIQGEGGRDRTKARVRARVGARMRIKARTRPVARIGPGHG